MHGEIAPYGPSTQSSSQTPPKPTTKSSNSNIASILETGRRRSEALGVESPSHLSGADAQRLALIEGIAPNDTMDESSSDERTTDETTAIVARERAARANGEGDYGSTANGGKKLRSRNSALRQTQSPTQREDSLRRSESTAHNSASPGTSTREHEEPWWKRQLMKYGSLELDNKGSVARDHLALERTFLAWLRTSLAFASIGIAITQLFRLNTTILPPTDSPPHITDSAIHFRNLGKPLGATFLGISIVVLLIGFHRYFESQHWITRGKFPASRGSISIVAAMAGSLMVVSLVVVVVVEPRAR